MFTDTHCHVLKTEYDDPEQIINELSKNNIKRIIINGYNLETNKEVIKLCEKYDNVYGSIGLHPGNITENNKECLNFIKENILNPKIIAIGEIGLDYYYTKENKPLQEMILCKQLEIAQNVNKPVIIHNREATNDLLNILKKYNLKGIIHCFNGSLETAKEFIKINYKLGINGIITFKNSKLEEVVKNLPLSSILLETDCPYLTPEPYRKNKNEPKYILYTAKKLSETLNIEIKDLSNILEDNFNELFDIHK